MPALPEVYPGRETVYQREGVTLRYMAGVLLFSALPGYPSCSWVLLTRAVLGMPHRAVLGMPHRAVLGMRHLAVLGMTQD